MKKEYAINFINTEKALKRLGEALSKPLDIDNMNRDATIQRFEFTIELFWKLIKKLLLHEKVVVNTPREILQKAYAYKWIDNEKFWLQMLDDRNATSHTYKEENAEKIYGHIKEYFPELQKTFLILSKKFIE